MSSTCKENILIHNQNDAFRQKYFSDLPNGHWGYLKPYDLFSGNDTRQYIFILTFIIKFQLTKAYIYIIIF